MSEIALPKVDRVTVNKKDAIVSSLKNFMNSKEDKSFYNYKIFDYRIQDQIILN